MVWISLFLNKSPINSILNRGLIILLLLGFLSIKASAQEPVDTLIISRIESEAVNNSQVMDYAFYLTDVFGPRLTGSPGFKSAGDWTLDKLRENGLENVHFEMFDWGRSWSVENFSIHLVQPQYAPMIGSPIPWCLGTNGPVEGMPVLAPLPEWGAMPAEYDIFYRDFKGKLEGKILLAVNPWPRDNDRTWPRLSDIELDHLFAKLDSQYVTNNSNTYYNPPVISVQKNNQLQSELNQFLKDEGVAAILIQSLAYSGTVMTTGPQDSRMQAAWLRDSQYSLPPPTVVLASEHYRRITRLLDNRQEVSIRLELSSVFHDAADSSFNIVAEIPGHSKKDEVVLIGAHFDSWTAATGATDNAAGSVVVMEAMRILQKLGIKPDRTIRMVLWGGHEGAGEGSNSYLRKHFITKYPLDNVDSIPGLTFSYKPAYSKLSAYFNLDNGAGQIRGIHLQGNQTVRPIFQAWLEPFRNRGAAHTTLTNSLGTDHVKFDVIGIPGFQFIQDGKETSTPTHHSNMDVYDYLPKADLQQSAIILASFAYHAAMRKELLPRKKQLNQN
jgi:hypothetical protein